MKERKGVCSMQIKVSLKSISKRKASVQPSVYEIKGRPRTVRELILAVTQTGVEAYNRRMEEAGLLSYLTKEQIDNTAEAGKVSFGVNYGEKKASLRQAQENALQCFEDGVYRIFLNEEPLSALEDEITFTQDSVFTFVRLTMLAGRMW